MTYSLAQVAIEESSGRPPMNYESALCGSLGGAIAAAVTTPLDVLKTRIMLSHEQEVRLTVRSLSSDMSHHVYSAMQLYLHYLDR